MKSSLLKASMLVSIFLTSCDSKPEDDEVDYDRMVKNEEAVEWTSVPESDDKAIAGELFPEPQEVILHEDKDAPSKLDVSTIR